MTGGRNGLYAYRRFDENEELIVIANFDEEQTVDFLPAGEVILSNYNRTEPCGKYMPYECAVIRKKK